MVSRATRVLVINGTGATFAGAVAAVVELLRAGGVAAVPTETVYGLAGRGLNEDSVRAIYAAKGRPSDNPLILHVGDPEAAWPLFDLDDTARARARILAEKFWPGPLTIVGDASDVVPAAPRAGLPRVAVRVPAHPFARALARALGEPFAAPSANVSGRPSPTTARDVLLTLDRRVELVVDGGPCRAGIESTVVDVSGPRPRLLRPGALSLLEIRHVLPDLDVRAPGLAAHADDASPGLRHRHYAPAVEGTALAEQATLAAAWVDVDTGVVVRASTARALGARGGFSAVLPDDAAGFARELYAALYRAETAHPRRLLLEAPPSSPGDDDPWAAVRDRLLRATA
jgi:L-threonylcarbamoyladenylate synthase